MRVFGYSTTARAEPRAIGDGVLPAIEPLSILDLGRSIDREAERYYSIVSLDAVSESEREASHASWLLLNQIYQTHLNLPASPLMNHDGTYRLVHLYDEAASWIQTEEVEEGVRIVRDLNDRERARIFPIDGDRFRVERASEEGRGSEDAYGVDEAKRLAQRQIRQTMHHVD